MHFKTHFNYICLIVYICIFDQFHLIMIETKIFLIIGFYIKLYTKDS